jgi:hypothetical protein
MTISDPNARSTVTRLVQARTEEEVFERDSEIPVLRKWIQESPELVRHKRVNSPDAEMLPGFYNKHLDTRTHQFVAKRPPIHVRR